MARENQQEDPIVFEDDEERRLWARFMDSMVFGESDVDVTALADIADDYVRAMRMRMPR